MNLYLDLAEKRFNNYSESKWTQVSGSLCAAVATEAFLRTIFNSLNEDNSNNIAVNLGTALFYGISSLNIMPGTARVAALYYTLKAAYNTPQTYYIAKIIHYPIEKTLQAISDLAQVVFNGLALIFSKIPIDKPIWWAVSILIVLTCGYKGTIILKDRILQ